MQPEYSILSYKLATTITINRQRCRQWIIIFHYGTAIHNMTIWQHTWNRQYVTLYTLHNIECFIKRRLFGLKNHHLAFNAQWLMSVIAFAS